MKLFRKILASLFVLGIGSVGLVSPAVAAEIPLSQGGGQVARDPSDCLGLFQTRRVGDSIEVRFYGSELPIGLYGRLDAEMNGVHVAAWGVNGFGGLQTRTIESVPAGSQTVRLTLWDGSATWVCEGYYQA
ncbi:hypothetical protein [Parenemella sanctibonifatiensis]|uniref:Uncharacterized protein n=1 Tax=Parenemella sanctibonifatiensis TaxID=2016505 RepID=A0A255EB94_9ACTN|nr:hypothetical protein [Parenemella sanctibonifatiensis]OYN85403.1 hypothetical protein CGZ92_11510 [Parenemella sanctibonifatiensis]